MGASVSGRNPCHGADRSYGRPAVTITWSMGGRSRKNRSREAGSVASKLSASNSLAARWRRSGIPASEDQLGSLSACSSGPFLAQCQHYRQPPRRFARGVPVRAGMESWWLPRHPWWLYLGGAEREVYYGAMAASLSAVQHLSDFPRGRAPTHFRRRVHSKLQTNLKARQLPETGHH